MLARHESLKEKVPELHFKFGSWIEPSDPEFLDLFTEFLKEKGYDPTQLIYSGFDGTPLTKGKALTRDKGIFGMNLAAWKRTLNQPGKHNPAMYAMGRDVPVVGIYDKNQLAKVYKHGHGRRDPIDEEYQDLDNSLDFLKPVISVDQVVEPPSLDVYDVGGMSYEVPTGPVYRDEDFDIRDEDASIKGAIIKDENLSDLPDDYEVEEGVMHRDYPENADARPADALIGLVFLEQG